MHSQFSCQVQNSPLFGKLSELYENLETLILIISVLLQLSFHPAADPCYDYKNLSEANRKMTYSTPVDSELCDYQLPEGWYRFVGAAGTKMPTTRVPAFRCGTNWSGWLNGAHPTVEDG